MCLNVMIYNGFFQILVQILRNRLFRYLKKVLKLLSADLKPIVSEVKASGRPFVNLLIEKKRKS